MRVPHLACAVALALAALTSGSPLAHAATTSPCAPPAAPDPMPEGSGHNHASAAAHTFACGLKTIAALDLMQLVPEPMMFGEIDRAGTLAVLAETFPEAGFITIDVTNPHRPQPLARVRATACETETDTDCGADLKVTPDGRWAFLALQRSGRSERAEEKRIVGGIAVFDLGDPRHPRRASFEKVAGVGVHTLTYHVVGGVPYVFARTRVNGRALIEPGVTIYRFNPRGTLTRIADIAVESAHDMSLYDDPVDHTTTMALSGAQSGTLFFYDVGDPAKPRLLGQWKPTAEAINNVWYMHNATTFRSNGKRFTFAGPEAYTEAGSLPSGHGVVAGPLWLLDTTSYANPLLVGEWRNPGKHAAGDLTFSPHNTWYAGKGITWTAHYHGGVWLLDWSEVFEGRARRPIEIGYDVPNSITRPFVTSDAKDKFITAPSLLVRPLIWDVIPDERDPAIAYASDINGGFLVLQRIAPARAASASPRASGSSQTERKDSSSSRATAIILAGTALVAIVVAAVIVRRGRRRLREPR